MNFRRTFATATGLLFAAISAASSFAAADLAISVTVTPQTAKIGDTITYHCVVTNVGTETVSTFYVYAGPDNTSSTDDLYTSYQNGNPAPFYVDQTGFKYIQTPATSLDPNQSTVLDLHYTATANGNPVRLIGVASQNDADPSNDSINASCTIANPSGGANFDAVRDFNYNSNGTLQVWQYGYTEIDGTGYTPYSSVVDDVNGNLRAWKKSDSDMAIAFNKTAQDLSYNSCTTQQADVLGLFPGNDGRKTVLRWKAPAAGTYTVVGRFQDIDTTTSDMAIVKNGNAASPLFSATINDGTCNQTAVTKPFNFNVTVAAGDTIDFRVGWGDNQQYSYDGTGVKAVITTVGSPTPTPTPVPTPTPRPSASPTPPPYGGLSATTFTVNEKTTASANVADTVLRFAAVQAGQPANLRVRVQSSTTPNTESSWKDLSNGFAGVMTYDPAAKKFILGSLNYPLTNGVYFRAIASASGYADSISNKVGPFNLASNRPRLVPPVISVTANGPFADLYFRAVTPVANSSIAMRVQYSTNPTNELSWTDLNDGHAGHMSISNDPKRYYLLTNKTPTGHGIYFRVVESYPNYVDGITGASGPYVITADTPPVVTMISPHGSSGNGASSNPVVVNAGTFHFGANASTSHAIKSLQLLVDGSPIYSVASQHAETDYSTNVLGDHIIEAMATDELGATARASTGALYVRVVPPASAEHAESASGHSSAAQSSSGKVFVAVKNNGLWNDPATWHDERGKNGVPGANDLAIINTITVKVSAPVTIKGLVLDGEIFNIKDIPAPQIDFTVTGLLTVTPSGGDIFNMHLIVASGATCELLNAEEPTLITGSVDNYGHFNVHGTEGIRGLLTFNNHGVSNFQAPTAIPANAGKDPTLDVRSVLAGSVLNQGSVSGSLTAISNNSAATFISLNGSSLVAAGGGNLIGQDGAGLIGQDGAGLIGQDGAGLIGQDGAGLIGQDGAGFHGASNAHAASAASGFVQTSGNVDLSSVLIQGPVTLNGGTLSGTGTIYGSLTNNSGYISPGHSPGSIVVTGDFTQGANGTLVLEDGGALPGQFDQLYVGGNAKLGGQLDLKLINGYHPSTADKFSPLGYSSHTGKFDSISSNANVTLNATGLVTGVNPAIASPKSGQPLNISTRAEVLTGDNVMVGGFIVGGPAGSTKKVIIRGLGPSLAAAGLSGALSDPYLELHKGAATISSNDNWKSNQAAVQATGIAPKNDKESAIVANLAPGAYTVILRGAHNETGVGLVELYDLNTSAPSALFNISTRCVVQTGDNVLIGGFILTGSEPAKVIVRALGPSLSKAGVKGALSDPVLELHNANGSSITNNDWRETQEAEIQATKIPPASDKESAIVATLPPGPYTAIVRGNNDTTGVALVEAYTLP